MSHHTINVPYLNFEFDPSLPSTQLLIVSALLIVLPALYLVVFYDKRRLQMPPYVKGWPIINQTLDHLSPDVHLLHQKWHRKYGDVYCTKSGATTFIWLSSPKAVKDLVDRRSAIYSSRPPLPLTSDVLSGGRRVAFMPRNNMWRALRGIFHRLFSPTMVKSYAPIQTYEAKQLSYDLLNNPKDFYKHNRRYATSFVLNVTYGKRAPIWECKEIADIYGCLTRFGRVRRPGSFIVDTFPSLAKNPIYNAVSSWRKVGEETFKLDSAVFMNFWNETKARVEDGTGPHCFGKVFVQSDFESQGLDDLTCAYTCGGFLEGGSETTSLTMNNCIIGMLSNPEVIKKAHEELDRVIGSSRTPTFEDEPNLQYIRQIIKETLRWRPINKLGANHYATQDDWYEGMFIPKGSIIMVNWWALHYDPNRWKIPEKFDPDRMEGRTMSAAEEAAGGDPLDRSHFAYGGGRRICPGNLSQLERADTLGMHIAERSLFLNLSRLLWGFNIEHDTDENGNEIPVDYSLETGIMPGGFTVPKPFAAKITVRSPERAKILREQWELARKTGVDFSDITFDKVGNVKM